MGTAVLALGLLGPGASPAGPAAEVLSVLHRASQASILIGELAHRKGHAAQVRRYGDRLARDARHARRLVLRLSADTGLGIVEVPPDAERLARLRALSGPAFDAAVLAAAAEVHEPTLAALESARGRLEPSRLRNLVEALIPIVAQHRDLAVRLSRDPGPAG